MNDRNIIKRRPYHTVFKTIRTFNKLQRLKTSADHQIFCACESNVIKLRYEKTLSEKFPQKRTLNGDNCYCLSRYFGKRPWFYQSKTFSRLHGDIAEIRIDYHTDIGQKVLVMFQKRLEKSISYKKQDSLKTVNKQVLPKDKASTVL